MCETEPVLQDTIMGMKQAKVSGKVKGYRGHTGLASSCCKQALQGLCAISYVQYVYDK